MISVLTPTGTLGYGFDAQALARGMRFEPDVVAVDAGSTDPGPAYLGSAEPLCSRRVVKGEIAQLLRSARGAGIPLVIGSAGGSGRGELVDWTADIVREVAREQGHRFPPRPDLRRHPPGAGRASRWRAERSRTSRRDSPSPGKPSTTPPPSSRRWAGSPSPKPWMPGAHVVVAGRACDDLAIAAYPIAAGADVGLATHMGKILECGAFSAEPFAMDVMLGFLHDDHFVLEPGSLARRASLKSVAAHKPLRARESFPAARSRGLGGSLRLPLRGRGRTPGKGLGRAVSRRPRLPG